MILKHPLKKYLILLFLCLLLIPIGSSNIKAGEKTAKIVFLGDSLTEGYGIEEKDSYPALIGNRLKQEGNNVEIINAGISGSTSAGGYGRLKWLIKNQPDIILLALGANDGLRGLSTKSLKDNLSKTVQLAQSNNIRIILAGMMIPPNYGRSYANAFNQVFKDIAKEYDIPLIPFLLEDVAGHKKLNIADGIHPNEKGHQIIAETVFPYIKEQL